MPQGKGYWYNPKTNATVIVDRHEKSLKKDEDQKKLGLPNSVKEALNNLPLGETDIDVIRMMGVRAGLVRVRDWLNFLSIQFYAEGNKAKDVLFSIAELIEAHRNKDTANLDSDTKMLAKEFSTAPSFKIDNLATKDSDRVSPNEFLEKYAKEGYMEEKKYKKENDAPIYDLEASSSLMEEVDSILEEYGYFKEQEIAELFSERQFLSEAKKYNLIDEAQRSQYRAWKHIVDPGVFGIITAYRGEYQDNPDEKGRRNKERQRDLISKIKAEGFGVFKLYGAWDEGGGVGREESLLWYPLEDQWDNMKAAGKRLFEKTKEWCKEYDQDGALYRAVPDPNAPVMTWRHKEEDWDTGEVTIINDSIKAGKGYRLSDDVSQNEGKLYINKLKKDLSDAWSELKKGPKDRNFVFENIEIEND